LNPCPTRESITGKNLLGGDLPEEDLVDLVGDGELGFELLDPAFRGGEVQSLLGAQPRDLTAVDPPLLQPGVDGGVAHAEGLASWAILVPDRASSIT
jgi:hypothetical protein